MIGNRIREFRKARELSLTEVAEIAGTTQATISRLETGEVELVHQHREAVAKALGVPWQDPVTSSSGPLMAASAKPVRNDTEARVLDAQEPLFRLEALLACLESRSSPKMEHLGELIGTSNAKQAGRFLIDVWEKKVRGHWLCPCDSGRIIRKCHRDGVCMLQNAPVHLLAHAVDTIVKHLQAQRQSAVAGM